MRRNETPYPIWLKFCMVAGIPDVITRAYFGNDRLRGLRVTGGQIFPFPIGFRRRPYNTLALPCECVIVEQMDRRTEAIALPPSLMQLVIKNTFLGHSWKTVKTILFQQHITQELQGVAKESSPLTFLLFSQQLFGF